MIFKCPKQFSGTGRVCTRPERVSMENEKKGFSHSGLLGHKYDKEADRSSDEVAEVGG